MAEMSCESVMVPSIDEMDKLSKQEKSSLRRKIFNNHEITRTRARLTVENAGRVQELLDSQLSKA